MRQFCNVEVLSADGRWEDVFNCLGLDQDATVELTDLKVPLPNTSQVHKDIATTNTLDIILALILLTDQFFFVALLVYCGLITLCYVRLVVATLFFKFQRKLRAKMLK